MAATQPILSKEDKFKFLGDISELIITALEEAEVPQNPTNIASSSLISTIAANISTIKILIENDRTSSASIILRNSLEANIDIINILKDRNYIKSMNASYLEQDMMFYTNYKKLDSEIKKSITNSDFFERKKKIKIEFNKFKKYKLSISNKFKKANSIELYYGIYNTLCRESHNCIDALSTRHLSKNNDSLSISIFKETPTYDINFIIDTSAGISVSSAELFFAHLGKSNKNITTASEMLAKFRTDTRVEYSNK